MRRFGLVLAVTAGLAALAPAGAMARHHGQAHRSKTHHAKAHRVRFERFGSSGQAAPGSSANGSAGTVQSYDTGTGKLTILLSDGTSTVSGLVTDQTRLACAAPSSSQGSSGDDDAGESGTSQGDAPESSDDSGDESGQSDEGDRSESTQSCSTASLTPGAVVQDAELAISSNGSVWRKVNFSSERPSSQL